MTALQRYNCMDTVATFQLWQEFKPLLAKYPWAFRAYDETRALQGPALYAMTRGILVDQQAVAQLRTQFIDECKRLEQVLDKITRPLRLGAINLASPTQVIWMLESLGATVPRKFNYRLKRTTQSADRAALEGIAKADWELAPICNILLHWRDRAKMLTVLAPTLTDRDSRMRTFYKVSGTNTWRWASGMNAWANKRKKLSSGMNMQNIKRDEDEEESGHVSIRSAFVADPGRKFLNVDLERADSWIVALEVFQSTGDERYLNACAARDLHTYVSKLIWPNLGWTGDEDSDIAIAKGFFYRQYDYRFMSKKLQHGRNYLGKPRTLALQMKVPVADVERGSEAYAAAFPGILKWHAIKAKELQTKKYLTNVFGARRNFHGRLDDDATLRAAIGFLGQSGTAKSLNRAILRLWAVQLQIPDLGMEFLAQVHDSTLLQFPDDGREQEIISIARQVMATPITVTSPQGKSLTVSIPLEVSVGWNWASQQRDKITKQITANPDGLIKLKPGQTDDRKRQRPAPAPTSTSRMAPRLSSLF